MRGRQGKGRGTGRKGGRQKERRGRGNISARSTARPDALLRSASGPEVKGSAIRRGIGNYSPERGRASVTFITELSASLGKQCASFNPRPPLPSHPRTPSCRVDPLPSCVWTRSGPATTSFLCRSLSFSLSSPPPPLAFPLLSAPYSRQRDIPRRGVPSSRFTLERNQRPI